MKTMRARILEAIDLGCHLTTDIIEFCSLELQYNKVCAILAELQIKGKVEYISGGGYYLTNPVRKHKVTLTDGYSGRSVNLIVGLNQTEVAEINNGGKDLFFGKLSKNQAQRIESFFGKMNAYYTNIEIE